MLKIKIVAVGKIRENYLHTGISKFKERLRPYVNLEEIEVTPGKTPRKVKQSDIEKCLQQEGELILNALAKDEYCVVLDREGKLMTSRGLARSIQNLQKKGQSRICFIIGGAFGLDKEVIKRGDYVLSFSPLTFTHEMMRLILLEQVYRAFKIIRGEPYHW